MDENDLDFRLRVNCEHDFDQVRKWFRESWTDFGIDWIGTKNSGTTAENWIEIQENDEYDPSLTKTTEGWFYYPYIIDVIFKKRSGSVDDVKKQQDLAQKIMSRLEEVGCSVKLIS